MIQPSIHNGLVDASPIVMHLPVLLNPSCFILLSVFQVFLMRGGPTAAT